MAGHAIDSGGRSGQTSTHPVHPLLWLGCHFQYGSVLMPLASARTRSARMSARRPCSRRMGSCHPAYRPCWDTRQSAAASDEPRSTAMRTGTACAATQVSKAASGNWASWLSWVPLIQTADRLATAGTEARGLRTSRVHGGAEYSPCCANARHRFAQLLERKPPLRPDYQRVLTRHRDRDSLRHSRVELAEPTIHGTR